MAEERQQRQEKFIKVAVKSKREFDKVRKKPQDVKVKEEPVGRVEKKAKKVDKKEKHCFRCREAGWTGEHGKFCKAMKPRVRSLREKWPPRITM